VNHDPLHAVASGLVRALVWIVAAVMTSVAVIILAFRIWGIPDNWQTRIREELGRRGMHVHYEKLYIDPAGRVIIRDAVWRSTLSDTETLFRAKRVRCGIAWWSWWRRQPFLEAVDLIDASIETRLDETTRATVHDVRLSASLAPEEFILESLSGRILNVRIEGSGRIPWASFRKRQSPGQQKPIDLSGLAPVWRRAIEISSEIESAKTIDLALNFKGAEVFDQYIAEISLDAPAARWRGIRIQEIRGTATFQANIVRIPKLEIRVEPDTVLTLSCRADLGEKRASAVAELSGNPNWLLPLLPESTRKTAESLKFGRRPSTRAEIQASWDGPLALRSLIDADWHDFQFAGRKIDRVQIPAAFESGKIFIPEASLKSGDEAIVARFLRDAAGATKAAVTGKLNPALVQPLVPAGAQPFLNSCEFTEGVSLNLQTSSAPSDPKSLKVTGDIEAREAKYKGVPLKRVAANVDLDGRKLMLRNIVLAKEEGEGTCPAMSFDLDTKLLEIENARGSLHVQETAHLFGGNFEKYCRPYNFATPPEFELDGLIDLGGGALSRFDLSVRGSGLEYPFLGVIVPAPSVRARVVFNGMRMKMESLDASVYNGGLGMAGDFDFTARDARFDLRFDLRSVAFERLMRSFFKVDDVSGVLSGKLAVRGVIDRLATLDGTGRAEIRQGNILKIPIFGGLSALMNVIIPNLGYARAENAATDFVIENGVVRWKDLALKSTTFAMICSGDYNMDRDRLDVDARVNMRGPVGFMLFPVSKLFEYHGTGPLKNVTWGAKILGK